MQYRDKKGELFWIREGGKDDIFPLVEMYVGFHPKGAYQGLPPFKAQACEDWIRHLFAYGHNFIAGREDRMFGHAVLVPDKALNDGEYLVFVNQHHRGQGIGTVLTRTTLARARDLGLTLIWLTVDACNFIAIRLYRKFGFCFSDAQSPMDEERKMVLTLGGDRAARC